MPLCLYFIDPKSRNLDWAWGTGIAKNKLITLWRGVATPHVGVGFAGLYGALAGMSSTGVSVGESGDDNKRETLDGTPWVLRLRSVMERASTIEEVLAVWKVRMIFNPL